MRVITFFKRKKLRKTAVSYCDGEQKIQAFIKRFFIFRKIIRRRGFHQTRGNNFRQKCDLRVSRAVVNRRFASSDLMSASVSFSAFGKHRRHIEIFFPTAVFFLIKNDLIGDARRFVGLIPKRRLIENVVPRNRFPIGLRFFQPFIRRRFRIPAVFAFEKIFGFKLFRFGFC